MIEATPTPAAPEATSTRERLSDYAHEAWGGWMRYLFSKSRPNPDGSVTIPPELVERWSRQIETPYAQLSHPEQESDRKEADKMLAIVFDREARLMRILRSVGSHLAGWARRGDFGSKMLLGELEREVGGLGDG